MEKHPSLQYLNAVRKHWGSLVTGGVFIGGLGIWQGVGHSVAPWVYWLIAILGLGVASFFAWKDERQKLLAEQLKNEGSRIEGDIIVALVGENGDMIPIHPNLAAPDLRLRLSVCVPKR